MDSYQKERARYYNKYMKPTYKMFGKMVLLGGKPKRRRKFKYYRSKTAPLQKPKVAPPKQIPESVKKENEWYDNLSSGKKALLFIGIVIFIIIKHFFFPNL